MIDRKTIADAPAHLNTNDKAFWVTGWNEAVAAIAATPTDDPLIIEVVSGSGGLCLAVNRRRVAGPKPLGGGTVVGRWEIAPSALAAST